MYIHNVLTAEYCDKLILEHPCDSDIFINEELSNIVKNCLVEQNIQIPMPWFFKRYNINESIGVHADGHRKYGSIKSFATIIIYLNDDFKDGETCIVDYNFHETTIKTKIKPVKGSAYIFDQDIYHMSNPASKPKYILRNDLFII